MAHSKAKRIRHSREDIASFLKQAETLMGLPGFTESRAAAKLGIPPATLNRWRRNYMPNAEVAAKETLRRKSDTIAEGALAVLANPDSLFTTGIALLNHAWAMKRLP